MFLSSSSSSSSLSLFFVQLHVRYHGCIKIFNFIQTDLFLIFDLLISLFQLLDEDYSVIDILNVLHKSFFAFNLSSRNFELSIDTLNAVDRLLATKY